MKNRSTTISTADHDREVAGLRKELKLRDETIAFLKSKLEESDDSINKDSR